MLINDVKLRARFSHIKAPSAFAFAPNGLAKAQCVLLSTSPCTKLTCHIVIAHSHFSASRPKMSATSVALLALTNEIMYNQVLTP